MSVGDESTGPVMERRSIKVLRRIAPVVGAAAVVLALFTHAGYVSGDGALALLLILAVAMACATRRQAAGLAALAAFLDRLADGDYDAANPEDARRAAGPAIAAAGRLRRRLAVDSAAARARAAADDAIIDTLPDPLLLLDAERRIHRANAAARAEFGDQIEGRMLSAVLRHPGLLEAADRAAAFAESRIVELATPSPALRRYSVNVQPSPHGAQGAVIVSLRDVTALKQNERVRADFIANASHELRTPLSSLIGFIETLQGPARMDAAARERFLPIMRDQAARMARLVDSLMRLSRIETTEHVAPNGVVDLVETARAVAAGFELRAREREIAIDVVIPDAPATIVGDRDEIMQLAQNLIDNAIKYGRHGGRVLVSVRLSPSGDARLPRSAHNGAASIAVTDDGAGVAVEHIPRLTERFYRVDEARAREMGGLGLGLSIVKHIANRHSGVVEIESAPDAGATFRVLFPACAPGTQAQDDAALEHVG